MSPNPRDGTSPFNIRPQRRSSSILGQPQPPGLSIRKPSDDLNRDYLRDATPQPPQRRSSYVIGETQPPGLGVRKPSDDPNCDYSKDETPRPLQPHIQRQSNEQQQQQQVLERKLQKDQKRKAVEGAVRRYHEQQDRKAEKQIQSPEKEQQAQKTKEDREERGVCRPKEAEDELNYIIPQPCERKDKMFEEHHEKEREMERSQEDLKKDALEAQAREKPQFQKKQVREEQQVQERQAQEVDQQAQKAADNILVQDVQFQSEKQQYKIDEARKHSAWEKQEVEEDHSGEGFSVEESEREKPEAHEQQARNETVSRRLQQAISPALPQSSSGSRPSVHTQRSARKSLENFPAKVLDSSPTSPQIQPSAPLQARHDDDDNVPEEVQVAVERLLPRLMGLELPSGARIPRKRER